MIRVFTAFSGYDSQCLALNSIGMDYELVGWSEIDKYAIKAHNALFPQWADRNYGDISKIDWTQVPDFDLFTYSSPCQDFSRAGKQKGAEKGSGTRSSLLWECERAIRIKRPKYLLFENVAAVASKKFVKLFNSWQLTLERMGYTNFAQILNAKTHGYPTPVPQNRERLFMVSILDCEQAFYFPDAQPLTQRLVDVLEADVDESYYLKDELIECIAKRIDKHFTKLLLPESEDCVTDALRTGENITKQANVIAEPIVVGWVRDEKGNVVVEPTIIQRGRGFNKGGKHEICPTISANSFEYNNHVLERIDGENDYPTYRTEKGVKIKKVFPESVKTKILPIPENYRIRKLTPRECFRLMGVRDADIDKIQAAGISKSQQYKMAGNSIVVNCLAAIFRQLFIGNLNKVVQTEIF